MEGAVIVGRLSSILIPIVPIRYYFLSHSTGYSTIITSIFLVFLFLFFKDCQFVFVNLVLSGLGSSSTCLTT